MYQSPRLDNEDDVTCSLIHSESESKENEKIQENEYFKVLQEVLFCIEVCLIFKVISYFFRSMVWIRGDTQSMLEDYLSF